MRQFGPQGWVASDLVGHLALNGLLQDQMGCQEQQARSVWFVFRSCAALGIPRWLSSTALARLLRGAPIWLMGFLARD